MTAGPAYYAEQGRWSDPGGLLDRIADLPADVAGMCSLVQGLLIHDCAGSFYGEPPADFHLRSRATQPVARRLSAILAADPRPLSEARPPFERSLGTCRDFALLLSALLRRRGVAARVRCGFASYFGPVDWFEDHWVCEYWRSDSARWALADAQLDPAHRRQLSIDFDISDMPRDQFHAPWRVWQRYRAGESDLPARYGHGEEGSGAWFLGVNLARDMLSLRKQEVTPWDSWREASAEDRVLDQAAVGLCDRLADLAESSEQRTDFTETDEALAMPPWRRKTGQP